MMNALPPGYCLQASESESLSLKLFCRNTEECTCVIAYCKVDESWAAEKEDSGRELMGKVLSNMVS